MDISNLRKAADKVSAGDWVDGIPEMGDLRLKVRGISNAEYKAIFARLARAVPKKDRERDNTIKDDVLHRIRGEALHQAVLLDWEGLTSDGKAIAFDKSLALKWLTDPEFEDFQFATLYAAGVVGKGRDEAQDELAKNSKGPSAGN